MRDNTRYIVLICFCFAFYLLCFLSLHHQIEQRDYNLKQFVCDNLGISGLRHERRDAGRSFDNMAAYKINEMDIEVGLAHMVSAKVSTNKATETAQKNGALLNRHPWKLPRCPKKPPGLVGMFNSNEGERKPVKYGGIYKPSTCQAVEKVAIVVPYRDRADQLDLFLRYMHKFLQKQLLEYTIFVVEMALPTQFNRGMLANVGFVNAISARTYTCIIFHDVDLLPANDTNMYVCGDKPRHMSVKNSKYGYKLPYEDYFGGIVAFRPYHFIEINGFSNMYFGWGAEDDDLRKRLEYFNKTFERPTPEVAYYKAIAHDHDTSNPKNPIGMVLLENSAKRVPSDGLNNLRYTRLALEFRDLYTWIYIRVNETQYMDSFTYLQSRWKPPAGKAKGIFGGKPVIPFVF